MKSSLSLDFKRAVWLQCNHLIKEKLQYCRLQLKEQLESLASESKSTAGDKHETGRAMAQLEVEMIAAQLAAAEKLLNTIHIIKTTPVDEVGLGALVTTDKGIFYFGISIGKVNLEGTDYFIVSAGSPIGKVMMGKKAGDTFLINGQKSTIVKVE